jgi:thiamine-phosphate diphosphorylase
MRLEDAFLSVTTGGVLPAECAGWCREAIAGGADLIQLVPEGMGTAEIAAVAEVCREDDALFVVEERAELAAETGADGVVLGRADGPIAAARAAMGMNALVGLTARSVDEAKLGLALGADYLVFEDELGAASLAAVRSVAVIPVFAGRIEGVARAAELVDTGVFRLCVLGRSIGPDRVREQVAEYSRLLGRSI